MEPVKRGRGRPPKNVVAKQPKPVPTAEILPPVSAAPKLPARDLNPVDPADIQQWPHTLPIEVALGLTDDVSKVCKAYQLTEDEWYWLQRNPEFQAECEAYREQLKTQGMSFKLKAQLQSEELLKESWRLIHHPDTPAPQKADLIKTTFRVAGYDNKEGIGVGQAVGLSINLILGDK